MPDASPASGGPAGGRLDLPDPVAAILREPGTRILVTGAGGWLGRATLEMLEGALGDRFDGAVHAFASSARAHRMRSGRVVGFAPLAAMADLRAGPGPTLLAHYAFLTRDKTAGMAPAAYAAANRGVTHFVTGEARRLCVAGTFSTSSGAVYEPDGALAADLAANPYGVLKREEEEAFSELAAATGGRAAICRVFNLAGPFINKVYALTSFGEAALAGRDIRIESARPVLRSYAHVRDVVATGLAGMAGATPSDPAPYDSAGEVVVEVGELARRILDALGSDRAIDRPEVAGAPHRYVGDGRAFAARAASAGLVPASLDEQIRATLAYMAGPDYGAAA